MHKGATRWVFLTKRYAIKIPGLSSWSQFLTGLLANMQECVFSKAGWPELCPVIFSIRGGWLVVMPRATPLSYTSWVSFDYESFTTDHPDYDVPVENKRSSFGRLNGRIVAIDYGS